MIAAHLGVVDEEQINNMSIVFFDDVLTELGYKLNYEAVVNYAGNSFCQKSWEMIEKSNPFNLQSQGGNQALGNLASFLGRSRITIMGGKENDHK